MKGDGTTKLFGNAGRYYIPLTNKLTDYFGGGTTDEHTYYVLNGWSPEDRSGHRRIRTWSRSWARSSVRSTPTATHRRPTTSALRCARDLKQVFQDEFILGFQQAINQEWSYGINATYRKVTRAVEDVRINHVAGCPWYSGDWPIINPGETNTLWCPDTNDWVTFDSSEDGYKATGSGVIMGYKKPRRTYKAVEFQLDRAWDDKWAFNASYIWSKSEGNVEGPVNSDTGYNDTNLVQYYDHPAVNERYGVLFNDHRHQIKLRGSYKLNDTGCSGRRSPPIPAGPSPRSACAGPTTTAVPAAPASTAAAVRVGCACRAVRDWTTRRAGLHAAGRVRPHAVGQGPERQRHLDDAGRRGST